MQEQPEELKRVKERWEVVKIKPESKIFTKKGGEKGETNLLIIVKLDVNVATALTVLKDFTMIREFDPTAESIELIK